jgi:hypothetical protein
MEQHGVGSGRRRLSGTVQGAFRSALLGWTDPVTGKRLTVQLQGELDLIESLGPAGFELLVEDDGRGGGEPVNPVAGRVRARARSCVTRAHAMPGEKANTPRLLAQDSAGLDQASA